MIITEKAKEALLKEFNKLHKDLLVISSDKDNPSSLSIEVVDSKDKSYEVMSGIKVSIEEDIKELFDCVTMDFKGGGFFLKRECPHHKESCENCSEDCEC